MLLATISLGSIKLTPLYRVYTALFLQHVCSSEIRAFLNEFLANGAWDTCILVGRNMKNELLKLYKYIQYLSPANKLKGSGYFERDKVTEA